MKETYKIHVGCKNCGYISCHPKEMVEITKGVTVDEELSKKECPECGCTTLKHNKF